MKRANVSTIYKNDTGHTFQFWSWVTCAAGKYWCYTVLRKGKVLSPGLLGKIAASISLKLCVKENGRCHTTDSERYQLFVKMASWGNCLLDYSFVITCQSSLHNDTLIRQSSSPIIGQWYFNEAAWLSHYNKWSVNRYVNSLR